MKSKKLMIGLFAFSLVFAGPLSVHASELSTNDTYAESEADGTDVIEEIYADDATADDDAVDGDVVDDFYLPEYTSDGDAFDDDAIDDDDVTDVVSIPEDTSADDAVDNDNVETALPDPTKPVYHSEEYLGDSTSLEITVFQIPIISTRSMTSQVEYSTDWKIINTKTNATYVQFTLRGRFSYNGSSSTCRSRKLTCINNLPSRFKVLSCNSHKNGIYAIGEYSLKNTATGKRFNKTLKVGVTPDGKLVVTKY